MSDEMKNHCPPETTAPKMHAHEATEKTEDIKPKLISTAHKRLSQDEFQRKVAMVARSQAVNFTSLSEMEKEAILGAALGAGRAALAGGKALLSSGMWKPMTQAGGWAASKVPWLARMRASGPSAWSLPAKALKKGVEFAENPFFWAPSLAAGAYGGVKATMPYIGGGLQRLGGALGGSVGMGQQNTQNFGGAIGGGLLGAGLGAVGGALMPGEEEYEDENGNIRKRRRGMLSGALRGAGMGGIAGGVGGAAMDYFGKQSAAQEFGAALARQSRA